MGTPAADEPGRDERVGTRNKVRDALHIGVEIPAKFLVAGLIVGAFNAGVMWIQFSALLESTKDSKASMDKLTSGVAEIRQHNTYQDDKLNDHEQRIRAQERKRP